jgi:riboflavin kinase/FMN adenylyltransferase
MFSGGCLDHLHPHFAMPRRVRLAMGERMDPLVLLSSASGLPRAEHPVLTVGNFDGVHLGHRVLLERLVSRAHELGRPAMVYTFEPTPQAVFGRGPHRILAVEDKVALLGRLGVDQVCLERFSPALSARSPEWFVEEVLGRRLRPCAMVVGHDFRFGAERAGDHRTVASLMPQLPIEVVLPLSREGRIVSSTRIRACIRDGRVGDAAELLGRPYSIRGTVVRGDRRGRELGFPTANLLPDAELIPSSGVYAVRGQVDGNGLLPGVANLGARPTVDGERFGIEVHLMVPHGHYGADELYGRELEVHFVRRLRSEKRFPGLEALAAQITLDVAEARTLLG